MQLGTVASVTTTLNLVDNGVEGHFAIIMENSHLSLKKALNLEQSRFLLNYHQPKGTQ
jgi:hypothetical protein